MVADAVLRNLSPTGSCLVTGENTGVWLFLLVNREGRNVAFGSERRAVPASDMPFELEN